ncbi:MAG: twin-arginine translocase subunit TatC [Actinomycetaceae bacterium]|nr:twin-arginine translocase subunit TatC [Actinomycetaceae bacterium]
MVKLAKRDPEGRMPLVDHLKEARRRLILILAGVMVGTVAGWFLYPYLFAYMAQPLKDLQSSGLSAELNFETVSAAFDLKLKLSMFAGFILTTPWWVYQIWAYIGPALKKKEKIYAVAFTVAGAILFTAGAAVGVWIMPHAVTILTSFAPDSAVMLMRSSMYFSFYMRLVIVFGTSFLVPLAMVGLNFMNVLRAKSMLKAWRWAVISAFVFTAFANPLPDPWNMTFQALAMLALYFLAVGISYIHDRRYDRRQAREEAELDAALAALETKEETEEL